MPAPRRTRKEKHHGKSPERLFLYWTSEEKKADALMEMPYKPHLVAEAAKTFDSVVHKIKAGDFRVKKPPEPGICKECDVRLLCHSEGIISKEARA